VETGAAEPGTRTPQPGSKRRNHIRRRLARVHARARQRAARRALATEHGTGSRLVVRPLSRAAWIAPDRRQRMMGGAGRRGRHSTARDLHRGSGKRKPLGGVKDPSRTPGGASSSGVLAKLMALPS
jgi:hypothetical protein